MRLLRSMPSTGNWPVLRWMPMMEVMPAQKVSPKAFCAAYVVAQKYGVDTSGFRFDKVCEMQGNGDKDSKELRAFIGDIRNTAYGISNHLNRNLGEQEQEFVADEFSVSEGSAKSGKGKKQPEKQPER